MAEPGNGNLAPAPAPSLVAVAAGLGEQTPLLAAILAELRSGTLEMSVSDAHRREMILSKFPITGAKRALVYRTGNGADAAAVPTATLSTPIGALMLPSNQARLGGQIVNAGAVPVILYLTERPVPVSGIPAIWLAASGGSWDFRLGNTVWCGNVSAIGQGGTSTITIAEV
jgi:hypothetical protein